MGRLAFVLCLLGVGCVESQSVRCDFGLCPIGTACDEVNDKCVQPDQLKVCKQKPDGEACTIATANDGVCKDEICVAPTCGDELVTTGEQCDASVPADGTCLDAAYDYGVLGCDATCSPSTDSCHRIGWHYATVPGVGAIDAMWEDGKDLWAATQTGVLHFDGTTWTGPTVVTGTLWWVRGIWAGNGQVFAVGTRSAQGVLAHYNGTTWTEMTVPEVIYAVWGRSANEVYAVGAAGTIYRYTGSWTKVSIVGSPADDLHAVWGNANAIAAVGDNGLVVKATTGTSFSVVQSGQAGKMLTGVWGSSATSVYAVGHQPGSVVAIAPLLLLYDGNVITDGSANVTVPGSLYGISGRGPNEIYIAGDGVVLEGDGVAWHAMEVPTSYNLNSIHAGADKVYSARNPEFFIEFEGAAWLKPNDTDPKAPIFDAWTNGTEIVAVGDCAFHQYGSSNNGSTGETAGWASVPLPTGIGCPTSCSYLTAVWGSSEANVYAGSDAGIFFHRVSGTWNCEPSPIGNRRIEVIWGTGASDVWVGGGDGTTAALAHYNGSSWQDMSTQIAPHIKTIKDIWGVGSNAVFVGVGGAIVGYNGSVFAPLQSPTMNDLYAVHGLAMNDVFAAGARGTILHYDGTSWSVMGKPASTAAPMDADIRDLCGRQHDDIFAIGGRLLLHFNGTAWSPLIRPDGDAATICRTNSTQLFTAGDLGTGSRLVGRLLP